MWLLYGTIVVLSVIVFKLGFCQTAPVLKVSGSLSLSRARSHRTDFFGVFLPVGEGLVVAALILIIYKIRLHQSKKVSQLNRNKK